MLRVLGIVGIVFAVSSVPLGLLIMFTMGVLYHEFGVLKPIGFWPSLTLGMFLAFFLSRPRAES